MKFPKEKFQADTETKWKHLFCLKKKLFNLCDEKKFVLNVRIFIFQIERHVFWLSKFTNDEVYSFSEMKKFHDNVCYAWNLGNNPVVK
jgi:hypothetical protein